MKKFTLYKALFLSYKKKTINPNNNYSHASGFTILEIIVSLLMGGIILSAALGGLVSMRQVIVKDRSEANVNQRLRTSFNTIGPDIQQIGEGLILQPELPAVLVTSTDIPSTSPVEQTSRITIRKRSSVPEIFICQKITAGETDITLVDLNVTPTTPECGIRTDGDTNGIPDVIDQWRAKRTDDGGTTRAYIFDSFTGKGEFFIYRGETTLPAVSLPIGVVNLEVDTGFSRDYTAGTTVIYLLNERTYEVDQATNQLQLTVNGSETFDLVENIAQMEVTVELQESKGSTVYECTQIPPVNGSCTPNYTEIDDYTWNKISAIDIKMVAQPPDNSFVNSSDSFKSEELSLSQKFFPRNRLSF